MANAKVISFVDASIKAAIAPVATDLHDSIVHLRSDIAELIRRVDVLRADVDILIGGARGETRR